RPDPRQSAPRQCPEGPLPDTVPDDLHPPGLPPAEVCGGLNPRRPRGAESPALSNRPAVPAACLQPPPASPECGRQTAPDIERSMYGYRNVFRVPSSAFKLATF